MNSTFVDALKVPAILSTLRKILHESHASLPVLYRYHVRSQGRLTAPPLTVAEAEALDAVCRIALEQALGAVILFALAERAFLFGGVLAGQMAQVFITVNAMTAPGSQLVNPGKWLIDKAEKSGFSLPALPESCRCRLALAFGQLAQWTGYHEEFANVPVKVPVESGRPLLRFTPLPDSSV